MQQFIQHYKKIGQFPAVLWIVLGSIFLYQAGSMAFVFLVIYLNQALHFSLTKAATVFAIFSASMLICGLTAGPLIRLLSAGRILFFAMLLNGLVILLFSCTDNFWWIIVFSIIWGGANGIYRPTAQTFVSYLSIPGLHKIAFSLYRLALNLGMSIGPAVGGYLAAHHYRWIFYTNGTLDLIAAIIFYLGLKSTTWYRYKPITSQTKERIFKIIGSDPYLRLIVLGMIPIGMVFSQHESTLSVYLKESLYLPLSFYGLLYTLNTLIIVVFELPINIATLHWPYRVNFMIGAIATTIGFGGLLFATSTTQIICLAIAWTIGEMTIYPAGSSYISDIATDAARANYMAIYSAAYNVGLLFGPWFGAYIMQHIGASALWIACWIWGCLSVALFYQVKQPKLA